MNSGSEQELSNNMRSSRKRGSSSCGRGNSSQASSSIYDCNSEFDGLNDECTKPSRGRRKSRGRGKVTRGTNRNPRSRGSSSGGRRNSPNTSYDERDDLCTKCNSSLSEDNEQSEVSHSGYGRPSAKRGVSRCRRCILEDFKFPRSCVKVLDNIHSKLIQFLDQDAMSSGKRDDSVNEKLNPCVPVEEMQEGILPNAEDPINNTAGSRHFKKLFLTRYEQEVQNTGITIERPENTGHRSKPILTYEAPNEHTTDVSYKARNLDAKLMDTTYSGTFGYSNNQTYNSINGNEVAADKFGRYTSSDVNNLGHRLKPIEIIPVNHGVSNEHTTNVSYTDRNLDTKLMDTTYSGTFGYSNNQNYNSINGNEIAADKFGRNISGAVDNLGHRLKPIEIIPVNHRVSNEHTTNVYYTDRNLDTKLMDTTYSGTFGYSNNQNYNSINGNEIAADKFGRNISGAVNNLGHRLKPIEIIPFNHRVSNEHTTNVSYTDRNLDTKLMDTTYSGTFGYSNNQNYNSINGNEVAVDRFGRNISGAVDNLGHRLKPIEIIPVNHRVSNEHTTNVYYTDRNLDTKLMDTTYSGTFGYSNNQNYNSINGNEVAADKFGRNISGAIDNLGHRLKPIEIIPVNHRVSNEHTTNVYYTDRNLDTKLMDTTYSGTFGYSNNQNYNSINGNEEAADKFGRNISGAVDNFRHQPKPIVTYGASNEHTTHLNYTARNLDATNSGTFGYSNNQNYNSINGNKVAADTVSRNFSGAVDNLRHRPKPIVTYGASNEHTTNLTYTARNLDAKLMDATYSGMFCYSNNQNYNSINGNQVAADKFGRNISGSVDNLGHRLEPIETIPINSGTYNKHATNVLYTGRNLDAKLIDTTYSGTFAFPKSDNYNSIYGNEVVAEKFAWNFSGSDDNLGHRLKPIYTIPVTYGASNELTSGVFCTARNLDSKLIDTTGSGRFCFSNNHNYNSIYGNEVVADEFGRNFSGAVDNLGHQLKPIEIIPVTYEPSNELTSDVCNTAGNLDTELIDTTDSGTVEFSKKDNYNLINDNEVVAEKFGRNFSGDVDNLGHRLKPIETIPVTYEASNELTSDVSSSAGNLAAELIDTADSSTFCFSKKDNYNLIKDNEVITDNEDSYNNNNNNNKTVGSVSFEPISVVYKDRIENDGDSSNSRTNLSTVDENPVNNFSVLSVKKTDLRRMNCSNLPEDATSHVRGRLQTCNDIDVSNFYEEKTTNNVVDREAVLKDGPTVVAASAEKLTKTNKRKATEQVSSKCSNAHKSSTRYESDCVDGKISNKIRCNIKKEALRRIYKRLLTPKTHN